MGDAGGYGLDTSHLNATESYRDFQLGHITEKITVVDSSLALSDAVMFMEKDDALRGLAVEELDKVIGVLSRETMLEKAGSRIELFKGKAVKAYLLDDSIRYDARDFCEKAFYEVIRIEDRKIANLVVYEGTHFFGVISVNHLIRHVSRIRELAYEQARYIQQFFLQKSDETIEGLEFAHVIRMAHQIGGDFYHIRKISASLSLFACFDVANKDIAASLTTGLLSSFFSMYFDLHRQEFDPLDLTSSLNRILVEQTPADIFVVGIILFFDLERKIVKIVNHGFSPLYLCTPKENNLSKLVRLNSSLMPLGINADLDIQAGLKEVPIAPHTKFFIYSDGLLDALDIHGNRFGEHRIKEFVVSNMKLRPAAFVKNLQEEFDAFVRDAIQADDFTAIMIEVE
jgi:sigma-B regulation protein RsbU (phosphoserine phosphatase)